MLQDMSERLRFVPVYASTTRWVTVSIATEGSLPLTPSDADAQAVPSSAQRRS
jgi:hypothetical protein